MPIDQSDLIAYLRDEQHIDDEISGETELFSNGLLDSVSMVGLITFIEERMGIVIQPGDVTLENFDTVDRIAAYLATAA